jgi:hypothetical protein
MTSCMKVDSGSRSILPWLAGLSQNKYSSASATRMPRMSHGTPRLSHYGAPESSRLRPLDG